MITWMWILVCHTERTHSKGVQGKDAKEDIWAYEGESKKWLRKLCNEDFMICTIQQILVAYVHMLI